MEVKIVIDGEEIILRPLGKSSSDTYLKFGEPEPYATMGLGKSPLIVAAFVRPGWIPSKGVEK